MSSRGTREPAYAVLRRADFLTRRTAIVGRRGE